MKGFVLITSLLAAAAVFAAAAQAGRDPRVCTNYKSASYCAQHAAAAAVTAKLAATTAQPSVICAPLKTPNLLRWKCAASDRDGHTWTGAVTFKKLAAGWHTYVTVRMTST